MKTIVLAPAAVAVGLLAVALCARPLQGQAPGQDTYRQECKSCHGVNGAPPARARGQYKKIRTVGDGGFATSLTTDSIVKILKKGIDKDMKSFSGKLNDAQMRAVAEFIRTLKPPVAAKGS